MRRLIYILVICVLPIVNKAQTKETAAEYNSAYRNVYWIHGVGGDESSLKSLSDYFSARYKINSYHIGYTYNRGIEEAARQVSSLSIGLQRNDDIVIAHSMGGLVSRQYYKDFPSRRFGGIITLNAPHEGAEFARSFDNGKINTFFSKIANEGVGGYNVMSAHVGDPRRGFHENTLEEMGLLDDVIEMRDDFTNIAVLVANILGNPMAGHSIEWLINSGFSYFAEALPNTLKSQISTIVAMASAEVFGKEEEGWGKSKDDLKPNSSIVTSLNNNPTDCPRITITGTVSSKPGMKFLGSRLSAMSQDNPGIGDLDNEAFIRYADAIISDSRKCKDEYTRLYRAGSWLTLGLSNSYFSSRRDAFDRQARFWESGFENEFQKCLGSYYYTTETRSFIVLRNICDNSSGYTALMPIVDDNIEDSGENCWQEVVIYRIVTIQQMHPNDGIVILPSQQGMEGATKYNIEGNDHEMVKKSQQTVDYVETQFDNQSSFFYTERK